MEGLIIGLICFIPCLLWTLAFHKAMSRKGPVKPVYEDREGRDDKHWWDTW